MKCLFLLKSSIVDIGTKFIIKREKFFEPVPLTEEFRVYPSDSKDLRISYV